jgi:uncharacterized protein (PEP-CTERM system associated)
MNESGRVLPLAVCYALALAGSVTTSGAGAAERWDFTPRVGISQIYTDNVTLAPRGEEEHEHITQLDTGFTASRQGARGRARLAYNLQSLAYWREERRNSTYHQFSGDGRADLLPERFFVNTRATYSQRLVSPGIVGDNISVAGTRADVFTFGISPTFIHRFGDAATGQLTYSYDRVDYQNSGVARNSSETNRVLANLDSGPAFTRIGWGLSYRRTETDFDDGSAVTFEIAEALARLNVTQRFSVFAAGGYEDNDFEQDPSRARPDDTFWRAGAVWQPGPRTSMEAFYGERFFGETYGGIFNHRFRNSRFFMNYTETPTTVSRFDIVREVRPVVDEFGDPVFVDGEPVLEEVEFPDLDTGVYLSKRFTSGFTGQRRKTGWGIRIFDERREFELTDERERVQGVSANVSWLMAPRTRLLVNGSVQQRDYRDTDREDTYYIFGTGLARDLGRRAIAALTYRYVERDGNQPENDYRENRVMASVRATF